MTKTPADVYQEYIRFNAPGEKNQSLLREVAIKEALRKVQTYRDK